MKKLLAVLLSTIAILSACGTSKASFGSEIRIINSNSNICNNGELYADSKMRMNFIDFTTLQSALLCSKPNCTHDDETVCSSFGMSNGATLYGSNIYFFESYITMDSDKAMYVTKLIKANIDGTGRKTVLEMNDRNSPYYDQRYLVGDTLFFTTEKVSFDEFGNSTNYSGNYLCSYNFSKGDYTEHLMAIEGWNAGIRLFGVYDGGIFYNISYVEKEIPWQNFFDPDFSVDFIEHWYRYDIKGGTVEELDHKVLYGQNGYCVEWRDGASTLYSPTGTTSDISFTEGYYTIVNDKLFDAQSGTVLDIESGKKCEMLSKDLIIYYIDGEYVTKGNLLDDDGNIIGSEYKHLSESEVIGDEIA